MSKPIRQISHSRWAQRILGARPELAAELAAPAPFTRDEMQNALGGLGDDELKRRLRDLRNRVLLRVMARDLSGRAGLDEVCGTMSDLAEIAIKKTLAAIDGSHLLVIG